MKNINQIDKKLLLLSEVMIIVAFICTYMIYGINKNTTGEVCIYDNIVYSEYYGFEMILLIPMIVIIQSQLKSSHRCIVIIRYKNIRMYWNDICRKVILECMFISSVIMVNLLGLCSILKITNACSSVCNWECDNSRFRYVSGYVMENYPSIIELMIFIFIQMFSIIICNRAYNTDSLLAE